MKCLRGIQQLHEWSILHYFLIEHPDSSAVVCVGGPHAGPAQVEQVPGVGELVPAANVVQHSEVRDAAEARASPEAEYRAIIWSKKEKRCEYKQFHDFDLLRRQIFLTDVWCIMQWTSKR